MVLAYFWRKMATNMKENGRTTREMDLIYTFGKFKILMKGNGKIRYMDRDLIIKIGKHTEVNKKIINSMEKEFFI